MPSTSPDQAELAPSFRSREVLPGSDDPLLDRMYELRFQVYCLETGFLPPDHYPDRREMDEYDASSAHFCALNLRDELVGYARLVRPTGLKTFPFQRHCTTLLEGVTLPEPSEAAEISRLMVNHDYRRRRGDNLASVTVTPDPGHPAHELRSKSPQILLSLYRQMYVYSRNHGIRYWYAAMEHPMARALGRMHFAFRQIGPQTDYYGPVEPYLGDLRELEAHLGKRNPELLEWLHHGATEH
jgi:N-acyl amino acid synthase of PEP-CTERM/exosortase system